MTIDVRRISPMPSALSSYAASRGAAAVIKTKSSLTSNAGGEGLLHRNRAVPLAGPLGVRWLAAEQIGEFRVTRRLAATIGLLAGLTPALAYAQTNIDQGKTPAQMFATDCAECHKAARALASGKNTLSLTEFLREHYTTSRDQAAALAAYVLSGRSGESGAAAAQGRGQKPAIAHAGAPAEETKPAKPQARQSKPDERAPATAKLQQRPGRGRHNKDLNATPPEEPATVTHEPGPVTHEPGPPESAAPAVETPSQETTPSPAAAAAPTDAAPGDNAPVPRDNIPD
jgi:hypothetical protein